MAGFDQSVLLVDDEDLFLRTFSGVCEQRYEVRTARCIQAAVVELDAMRFDVLITDYQLVAEKGTQLLQIARQRDPSMYRVLTSGDIQAASTDPGAELADLVIDKHELFDLLERGLPGRVER